MRGPALVFLVLVAMLAWMPAASAQTTGRIEGKIVDATGGAMPGVTMTVSSPALQGVRTTVTDGSGEYRFPTLPPGKYVVKAELSGFTTTERADVTVGIDRTVELNLTMSIGNVAETVTVKGAAPVIDITSTTTGLNATAEFFTKLPVRRDFYAIAQLAPGVSMDNSSTTDAGTTFAGSTGAENSYIIEGLNTTGIYLGNRGKTLNQDFVEEVEVKTGGLPAEYGRMTGGVINVLTKSGSNQFHGSFFGFAEGGGLQANDSTESRRPEWRTTVANTAHLWDVGVSAGGYIMKDRLWFFGAYNPQQQRTETKFIRDLTADAPGTPPLGSSVPTTTNTHLYSAKVTFKLANNHTLVFSEFGDPAKTNGALISQWNLYGPASTWDGTENLGGNDTVLRYDAVLSSTSFLRAQYARHTEKSIVGGAGRDIAQTQNQRVSPAAFTGGFGPWDDLHFARDVYKADISKIFPANEVKVGFDFEDISSNLDRYQGGAGQRIYLMQRTVDGQLVDYVRHRYFIDANAPGYSRDDPTTWKIALPLNTTPANRSYSVYAQDNVRLGRLSLNLGLRWEKQTMLDPSGQVAMNLDKNWAPRLGGIFDATGDGRTKIYANWGRFYEAIPMDLGVRAFGGELYTFAYNFDPSPSALVPLSDPRLPRSTILGGSTEPVDPQLTGQYIDETLAGFEREVGPNLTVGIRYAHRKLGNVVEDFLIPSEGAYFIANPGKGIGAEFSDYARTKTIAAPKAKRVYDSVQLTARKRYDNGWQLMASYVWSKLEGNYDGTFQVSTGQLDPNLNSAYDYSDFLVNATGRLSNDRTHFMKVDGAYEVQKSRLKGLNLGGGLYVASGFPLNAYGYSVGYSNWEYYLVPRGSLGRGPWDYEANLHVAYPITLGNMKLEPMMDIFNLLNRQAIRQYDERYNLVSDGTCAGVPEAICNGDGGLLSVGTTLTPVGSVTRDMATNPDFLKKGVSFTGQRSIRIGVRFTF